MLRKKCTSLVDALLLFVLVTLCLAVFRRFTERASDRDAAFVSPGELHLQRESANGDEAVIAPRFAVAAVNGAINNEHCTMGACFDFTKCDKDFRVYIYPPSPTGSSKHSPLFSKVLSVIKNSHYFTSDPEKACLFVPNLDTLDRDKLSEDYVRNLPELSSLIHWNGGRNHLIFNQYSGSWPNYAETLDFDTGKAIIAKASFNVAQFRQGFDISLPLVHKDYSEYGGQPGTLNEQGGLFPIQRKYLLAFKGKRYLYGPGRETRASIYHLHNSKDVFMLTSCKHNRDWLKYQDQRCPEDNRLYEKYDYNDLLTNSSFCLVPRGRRLGSFRFLESLQASCIPVSMSNGYVLPFHEVLEWDRAALTIDERQLLQVPHVVRSVGRSRVLAMRQHTQFLWETYFSSLEKIITSTLEIIRNRLSLSSKYVWNVPPGGLVIQSDFSRNLLSFPFYHLPEIARSNFTVVITCTKPAQWGGSPLVKLVKSIAPAPHLTKIVILWSGQGAPKISLPQFSVPVEVESRELQNHWTAQFWPLHNVTTSAVLHLSEDAELTVDEVEFGFAVWCSFPERLVGFVAHRHSWNPVKLNWSYTSSQSSNEYSVVLSSALFYHRYYGYLLRETLPPSALALADQSTTCLDLALNFLVAKVTRKAPMKVTQKKELSKSQLESTSALQSLNADRVACFNMITNAFGYVPLVFSSVRADPVLFKDNVSMLRKEYRKLEVL